jgi:hypothetical protein
MKYPDLVSGDLVINLVRIPDDRQFEYSGFAGFGGHEWKIREPGDATLDQILDRQRRRRGALIEIRIDAVEIASRL